LRQTRSELLGWLGDAPRERGLANFDILTERSDRALCRQTAAFRHRLVGKVAIAKFSRKWWAIAPLAPATRSTPEPRRAIAAAKVYS